MKVNVTEVVDHSFVLWRHSTRERRLELLMGKPGFFDRAAATAYFFPVVSCH